MASSTSNPELLNHTISRDLDHAPEALTPQKATGSQSQLSPVSALLASLGITREKLVERAEDVRKLLSTDQPSGSSSAAVEPVTPSAQRTVRTPLKRSNTSESLFTPPATSSPKRSNNPSGPVTPQTPSRTRKIDTMEEVIERKNRESANRSARKLERQRRAESPPSPSTRHNTKPSRVSSSSSALSRTQSTPNLLSSTVASTSGASEGSKPEPSKKPLAAEHSFSKYYRAHTLVDKFSVPATETAPPPPVKKKTGAKTKSRITRSQSSKSNVVDPTSRSATLRSSSSSQSVEATGPSAQGMNMMAPFGFPPQAIPVFVPVPQPLPGMPQLTQEQMQALFYQQFTLMMQQQQHLFQPADAQSPPSTSDVASPQVGPTTPKREKEVIDLLSPLPPSSSPPSSPPSSPSRSAASVETSEQMLPYTLPPGPYSPTKPSASYAAMIGQAILSSPEHRLTLQQIYDYITVVYPYFKRGETTWMNSIRHVLSTTKAFQKVTRDKRQGKTQWAIFDDDLPCFEGGGYKKHGAAASGSGGARKRKREVSDGGESPKSMAAMKKGRKTLKRVTELSEEQILPATDQVYPPPQLAHTQGPPLYAYSGGEHFLSSSPARASHNPPAIAEEEMDPDRLLRELEDALSSADDLDDLPPSDDFNFLESEDLPPSSDDFDAYTSSEFSDTIPVFNPTAEQTPCRSSSTPPTSLPPSLANLGFEDDDDVRSTGDDELPMLSPSDLLRPMEQWGKPSPIQPFALNYCYETKFTQDSDEDEPLDLHSLSGSQDKTSKDKGKEPAYPVSPSLQRTVKKRAPRTPSGQHKSLVESPLFTGPSSPKRPHLPSDELSPMARRHKKGASMGDAPSTPPRKSSLQLPLSSLRTPVTRHAHPEMSPSPTVSSRKLLFEAEDNPDPDDSFDSLFGAAEVAGSSSMKHSSLSDSMSYQQLPMTPKRANAPPVTPKRSSSKKNHAAPSGSGSFSGTPSRYVRSYASKNGSMSSPFRTPGSGSFPFANLLDDSGFNMSPVGFDAVLGLSAPKSSAFLNNISPSGISPKFGGTNAETSDRCPPSPSIRRPKAGW